MKLNLKSLRAVALVVGIGTMSAFAQQAATPPPQSGTMLGNPPAGSPQ